ncbi:hypothetical protein SNEBB_003015 [Seison nebaliae]|nr:hypothetical protein SNEBB_003015 [Seison nebaliae]
MRGAKMDEIPGITVSYDENDFPTYLEVTSVNDITIVQPHCNPDFVDQHKIFGRYRIADKIKTSFEGSVYKLNPNTPGDPRQYALKIMHNQLNFINEWNGLRALEGEKTFLFDEVKLYGAFREFDFVNNAFSAPPSTVFELEFKSQPQFFCLLSRHMWGFTLEKRYEELRHTSLHLQKMNQWGIVIGILRQLQLLHFSFNDHALFSNVEIFGRKRFTNFHCNIHERNIILNGRYSGVYYPHLIDPGLSVDFNGLYFKDMVGFFYNNKLLAGRLPMPENTVMEEMVFTHCQQMDICQTLYFLFKHETEYTEFHYGGAKIRDSQFPLKSDLGPYKICRQLKEFSDKLQDGPTVIKHLKAFANLNVMADVGIMGFLLSTVFLNSTTYKSFWLQIVQYFGNVPFSNKEEANEKRYPSYNRKI